MLHAYILLEKEVSLLLMLSIPLDLIKVLLAVVLDLKILIISIITTVYFNYNRQK